MLNKKGMFTPLIIILTLIFLTSLAFIISQNKERLEVNIGESSSNIEKTYTDELKINLFLNEAIKQTIEDIEEQIETNGGYAAQKCSIDNLEETYIIWNTCQELNPEKEFKEEFDKKIKLYTASFNIFLEKYYFNRKLLESEKLKIKEKYPKTTYFFKNNLLYFELNNLRLEIDLKKELQKKYNPLLNE